MRLCISASTAKNIGYFSSNSREVVRINFELVL
jgi:hypothetical protein